MTFYLTAVLLGLAFSAMAMGIFISMRIFNIPDITTDGSFTLGGAVTAILLAGNNFPPLFTLPIAFLAGAMAGAVTGFIHTSLRVHALLSGILVMTGLYSVNLAMMERSNIPLLSAPTIFPSAIGTDQNTIQFFILLFITLLLFIALSYLLKSDFGLAMRATGNNEKMIRSLGVHTGRMKVTGLALANGLTALSGSLIVQVQGYADINMGIGIVILGLGSVMIGTMFLSFLKSQNIILHLASVIAGSILFRLILAYTLSIGIDAMYLKLVTSLFVLLVVSIPNLKKST
ncbi:MAG: ABC transporter permease [Bacteroidia bacterium]